MQREKLSQEMKWNGLPVSQMSYVELKSAINTLPNKPNEFDNFSKPLWEMMLNTQMEYRKQGIK